MPAHSEPVHAWGTLRAEAERVAARFPPLLLEAERIAQTVAFGTHGRRLAGPGDTFWQFRRYEPEDAASTIDWRQSAKSQHIFVREREWEAAQTIWLWRDGSESMTYRSSSSLPSKRDRANIMLIALAFLLARGGERIGALAAGNKAGTGRAAVRRLAIQLDDVSFQQTELPAIPRLVPNASLIMAGDAFSDISDIEASVSAFTAIGVKGCFVQILDPAEEGFPFEGRIRFEQADGIAAELIGRAQSLRSAYRNNFASHQDELRRLLRRHGWSFLVHRTNTPPQMTLLALFQHLAGRNERPIARMQA